MPGLGFELELGFEPGLGLGSVAPNSLTKRLRPVPISTAGPSGPGVRIRKRVRVRV
jgi:hypothetical protein